MDYEKDFWESVEHTVNLLIRKGVEVTTFKASDGAFIQGWLVERWPENTDGFGPNNSPLERWRSEVILTVDGNFYLYGIEWTYGQGETRSLHPHSSLAGWEGKAFSKLKEQVERLPCL